MKNTLKLYLNETPKGINSMFGSNESGIITIEPTDKGINNYIEICKTYRKTNKKITIFLMTMTENIEIFIKKISKEFEIDVWNLSEVMNTLIKDISTINNIGFFYNKVKTNTTGKSMCNMMYHLSIISEIETYIDTCNRI